MKISRAIVSLSNKTGLEGLIGCLREFGVEILSTGGTWKVLDAMGARPTEISAYTGFPEIMDGRVKTLHPKVHGGILNVRDNREHQAAMNELGIKHIDMIVVNLYPFVEVVGRGCTFDEAIENIDIGGPSMIRAAAKNFRYVTVVVDPEDYGAVVADMKANNGATSDDLRFYLARKVFQATSAYDGAIAEYLLNAEGEGRGPAR
jgi:phosphoribosylaminoimidazolecarboxamide formyltransferase/IMP cyclohydrolase